MMKTWEVLHKNHKAQQKKAVVAVPTADLMTKYQAADAKLWHKTMCKGISAMAKHGPLVLTAGRDKQLCLYDSTRQQVVVQQLMWQSFAPMLKPNIPVALCTRMD
jgi:hypothetical protein